MSIRIMNSEITNNIAREGGTAYIESFNGNTVFYAYSNKFYDNYSLKGGVFSMPFFKVKNDRIILEKNKFSSYFN